MGNVVQICDFRITSSQRHRFDGCQHKHFTLDDNGDVVTCDDCGKQISAYYALHTLVESWGNAMEKLQLAQERVNKGVSTLAAQKVERAWRSRRMVPVCPHCGEAIYATDGFGSTQISLEIADRRKEIRDTQKGGA